MGEFNESLDLRVSARAKRHRLKKRGESLYYARSDEDKSDSGIHRGPRRPPRSGSVSSYLEHHVQNPFDKAVIAERQRRVAYYVRQMESGAEERSEPIDYLAPDMEQESPR